MTSPLLPPCQQDQPRLPHNPRGRDQNHPHGRLTTVINNPYPSSPAPGPVNPPTPGHGRCILPLRRFMLVTRLGVHLAYGSQPTMRKMDWINSNRVVGTKCFSLSLTLPCRNCCMHLCVTEKNEHGRLLVIKRRSPLIISKSSRRAFLLPRSWVG